MCKAHKPDHTCLSQTILIFAAVISMQSHPCLPNKLHSNSIIKKKKKKRQQSLNQLHSTGFIISEDQGLPDLPRIPEEGTSPPAIHEIVPNQAASQALITTKTTVK